MPIGRISIFAKGKSVNGFLKVHEMRVFLKKDKLYENKTCVINGLTTLSFPARWFRLPEGNLGTREAVVTDFYFHDVKYAMFTSIPKGWEIEVPDQNLSGT